MQIKAMILCHRLEQHKSLYSYKLFFDQNCTATHGKFPNKESARTHAEVLARRIKVSLKWEKTDWSNTSSCKEKMQSVQ